MIQEDFYMVRTALGKEQIDEVIKISETYFDDGECYLFGVIIQLRLTVALQIK